MKLNRILHVEDSTIEQDIIKRLFITEEVTSASTENEALSLLETQTYDLILLDLGLAEGDGLTLCQKIKSDHRHKQTPLIIISGKSEISDRVLGLDLGADDYVAKPFNYLELKARTKALQRRARSTNDKQSEINLGPLRLDPLTFSIFISYQGQSLQQDLTGIEFRLLSYLMKNPDQVLSREQILQSVWKEQVNVGDRTVDAKISLLRKKLGPVGFMLSSIYGVGYKLATQPIKEILKAA